MTNIPTKDDIDRAMAAARCGRGGKLAAIIKSTPTRDLAECIGFKKGDIELAIYMSLGMRQMRHEMACDRKAARRAARGGGA